MKAAEHYNGKGLQHGIDTSNTHRHIRSTKTKSDTSYQYKAAVEPIMSACSHPAARIKTINPFHDDICTRCGKAVETDFHVFWQCPCDEEIDHGYVSKSWYLCQQAVDNHEQHLLCGWEAYFSDLILSIPSNTKHQLSICIWNILILNMNRGLELIMEMRLGVSTPNLQTSNVVG